jgi:citrate lyase subunit beta/citryl-CoA lyase
MRAHSYLFVPADRVDRFHKALASGAHCVIVDLEDALAPGCKDTARDALARWLQDAPDVPVHLRINGTDTPWFQDDIALCRSPGVRGIVLPKAESAAQVTEVAHLGHGKPLLPLIETAHGMAAVRDIAGTPGVQRLLFGSIDFQADLGIDGDDDALLAFRSELVLASRLAGLAAPVDGVTTALDDQDAITRDTARARRLGFGGKLCIHPKQVAAVNAGFAPSDAEVDWARRVVQAIRASQGAAVAVDGKMVDAPVVKRAEAILLSADPTGHADPGSTP